MPKLKIYNHSYERIFCNKRTTQKALIKNMYTMGRLCFRHLEPSRKKKFTTRKLCYTVFSETQSFTLLLIKMQYEVKYAFHMYNLRAAQLVYPRSLTYN